MSNDSQERMENFHLVNVKLSFHRNGEELPFGPQATVRMREIPVAGDIIHLAPDTIALFNQLIRHHHKVYEEDIPLLKENQRFKVMRRAFAENGLYGGIDASITLGYAGRN